VPHGRSARRARRLLVLEDVHWPDASTRAVLSSLSRALSSMHLVATVTLGSEELEAGSALRHLLLDLVRR
jgi:hypothetical protein